MTNPLSRIPAKQAALLLGLAGTALVAVLYLYVVQPLAARERAVRERKDDLYRRIEQAERLLREEAKWQEQWQALKTEWTESLENRLPRADDPLSWASVLVYRHARAAGVAIDRMAEISEEIPEWARPAPRQSKSSEEESSAAKEKQAKPRKFVPYRIELTLSGSLEELKRFLNSLENDNPFVVVSSLSIAANDASPERHQVRLRLEWPRLTEHARKSIEEALQSP